LKSSPKLEVPSFEVYILTFTASHGQRAISANISAVPEAKLQKVLLYF